MSDACRQSHNLICSISIGWLHSNYTIKDNRNLGCLIKMEQFRLTTMWLCDDGKGLKRVSIKDD
jgi:hypothetical protein